MSNKHLLVKTVIVGSGVAGIACGINLLKNNYDDFIIFEALDRIGGRVHTIDYGNSFIEMGAQFIHGQQDNPLYYVARDHKQVEDKYLEILDDEENIEDNNGVPIDLDNASSYLFSTQFGEKLDPKLAYELYNIVNKLIREAKDYYLDKDLNTVKDQSAGEFVYEKYREIIEQKFPSNDRSRESAFMKRLILGFLLWRCKSENIEIGCHSVADISMKNYCVFKDCVGSQIIEPKYGYGNIIDFMIEKHKRDFMSRCKLKHALKKILLCSNQTSCEHCKYTDNLSKVVVIVADLVNSRDLIVICDNIVCTMSLGYLKENIRRLVEPVRMISPEKLLAIERIGYGTVNKIFLFYDKPFWDPSLSGIQPIWLFDENKSETFLNKLDNFNDSNWYESISYFSVVKNHANILCAWLAGCVFFEKFSDEKVSKDCTMVLRKFLNDQSIPEPNRIIKSTWNSYEYFKGSYSYLPIGSKGEIDLKNLVEPICVGSPKKPCVMFAGEATSVTQFSTLHGAYFTGIRESERILNLNLTSRL